MVSWHAEITSSKIVSTSSRVDLIFFTKSWENLGNTPKKGNSDAVHIFSSQFSRTERRGAKRSQTHRSVLNHLRRIRLLPSQGNFHLLQFHIPFLLHFRILCEPADCTLLQFHIRRGAGNTQEVFVRIRRVQTIGALSQFLSASPVQCASFGTWQGPSPMGHTKISFCCILTSPFLLTSCIGYTSWQVPLHLSSILPSIFLRYCIFISSKGSLLSECEVK